MKYRTSLPLRKFGSPIASCKTVNDKAGYTEVMRVTIKHENGGHVIMKIEGKIAGLHVPELHRAWKELAPSLAERSLLVDLRDVMHVDGSGRQVLANIHAETGAEFMADTPLTKYFAEQAQQDAQRISNLK